MKIVWLAAIIVVTTVLHSPAFAEPIQFQQPIHSGSGADWGPTGETITGLVDLDGRFIAWASDNLDGVGAIVTFESLMEHDSDYNGCSTYTCRFESEPGPTGESDYGASVMIWGYGMDTATPDPWWMSGIYWDKDVGVDLASFGSLMSPPAAGVPEPTSFFLAAVAAAAFMFIRGRYRNA